MTWHGGTVGHAREFTGARLSRAFLPDASFVFVRILQNSLEAVGMYTHARPEAGCVGIPRVCVVICGYQCVGVFRSCWFSCLSHLIISFVCRSATKWPSSIA
jgi:hypothetical protein